MLQLGDGLAVEVLLEELAVGQVLVGREHQLGLPGALGTYGGVIKTPPKHSLGRNIGQEIANTCQNSCRQGS